MADKYTSKWTGEQIDAAVETANTTSAGLETHVTDKDNPHTVTKAQVGLANVDNTSDANKPISTAQQNALNAKLDLTGGTLTGALTGTTIQGSAIKVLNSGSYVDVYSPANPPPSVSDTPTKITIAPLSWGGVMRPYTYTITAAAHGKGTTPRIEIYDTSGNKLETSVNVSSTGNIIIYSNAEIEVDVLVFG